MESHPHLGQPPSFFFLFFMSLRPNCWCKNCLCHNNSCLWSYLHDAFTILQIIHVLVAYMHLGNAWTSIGYLCHFFPCRYMRFVVGPNGCFKFEPKFLMAWKFSAPTISMYTPEIETKWSTKHCGGGGWYLDMPKGIIPYAKTFFHKECVAKQATSDDRGASIELPPHDD